MPTTKIRFQILYLHPKKHVFKNIAFFDAPKLDKFLIL